MKKKILFILDGPYLKIDAGGVMVDNIIKTYGITNFSVIGIRDQPKKNEFPPEYNKINFKTFIFNLLADRA